MRTKPKTAISVIIILFAAMIAAGFTTGFEVHLSLENSGAILLWNNQRAFVFISTTNIGHRVGWLRYPWFLAKGYLGGVEDPDDRRESLEVIAVTSLGVARHAVKLEGGYPGSIPDLYTPLEDRVYVNYPVLGGLCWWAGDHFERATPEERQRLDGIYQLTNKDIGRSENGWSKRSFGVGLGDKDDVLTIDVGNESTISVSNLTGETGGRILSIDLVHPLHVPERIWTQDLHWGIISKAEYQRAFRDPK